MKIFLKIAVWMLLLLPLLVNAQNIPAKPNPPRLVNDFAGVLSEQEKADLVAFLKSLTDHSFLSDPRFADPY